MEKNTRCCTKISDQPNKGIMEMCDTTYYYTTFFCMEKFGREHKITLHQILCEHEKA